MPDAFQVLALLLEGLRARSDIHQIAALALVERLPPNMAFVPERAFPWLLFDGSP